MVGRKVVIGSLFILLFLMIFINAAFDASSPNVNLVYPTNNLINNSISSAFVCNITDELRILNISLFIWNITTGSEIVFNTTNLSGVTNYTRWNISLIDGNYSWNCLGYDNSSNFSWGNLGNFSFTKDTTGPEFYNLLNISSFANSSFYYDVDAIDNTGLSVFSLNSSINFTIDPITGVITNSSELGHLSLYYLNISVNDSFGSTTSAIFFINISRDSELPSVILSSPSNNREDHLGNINFRYSAVDNSTLICQLFLNNTLTSTTSSVNYTGELNTFAIEMDIGTYTWFVNCTDSYGNSNKSSSRTLVIVEEDSSDSQVSGTGGVITALSTYWSSTYSFTSGQILTGAEKLLGPKERVKFKIGNEDHHVGVASLLPNLATINISSSKSYLVVFSIKDEKKFELNGDNRYDILVRLNNIFNNKANITVKSINETIVEEKPKPGPSTVPSTTNPSAKNNITNASEEPKSKSLSSGIGIGIFIGIFSIILLVIAVALYFYNKEHQIVSLGSKKMKVVKLSHIKPNKIKIKHVFMGSKKHQ
jgi:hypothetical protein